MRSAGYVGPFKARHGSCNMAENNGKCVNQLVVVLKHVLVAVTRRVVHLCSAPYNQQPRLCSAAYGSSLTQVWAQAVERLPGHRRREFARQEEGPLASQAQQVSISEAAAARGRSISEMRAWIEDGDVRVIMRIRCCVDAAMYASRVCVRMIKVGREEAGWYA